MRFSTSITPPGFVLPRLLPLFLIVLWHAAAPLAFGQAVVPPNPFTVVFDEDTTKTVDLVPAHFTFGSGFTTALNDPAGLIQSASVIGDTLTVVPKPDANGTSASVTVTVSGVSKTFNLQINGVNDAEPDAPPRFDEDNSVTVNVLVNDHFNAPASALSVSVEAAGQPANGGAVVNANKTITYTPDPNYFGLDTFTYTVTANGGVETETVSLIIDPVNDAPEITATLTNPAFSDGAAPLRGRVTSAALVSPTSEIVDVENDPLSMKLTVTPSQALAALGTNGLNLNVVQEEVGGIPVDGSFIVRKGTNTQFTPADATAALRLLAAEVFKDTITPGSHTISIDVRVDDFPPVYAAPNPVPAPVPVQIPLFAVSHPDPSATLTSVNDAPEVVALGNPGDPPVAFTADTIDVITNSTVVPFTVSRVALRENDAAPAGGEGTQLVTVTATLTGSAGGTFLPLTGVTLSNGNRTASVSSRNALDASQILSPLSYRAPASVPASGSTDLLTLNVTDGTLADSATITLHVSPPLTSPNILGARSDQDAQDSTPRFVFTNVTVLGNAPKTRVLIAGAIGETPSLTGTGVYGSLLYTGPPLPLGSLTTETDAATGRVAAILINAPPSEATAILRQIAFEPAPNVVTTATEINFRINLLDATGGVTSSDTTTKVRLAPVNDPPSILVATGSLPAVDDDATGIEVFEDIQVIDPDKNGVDLLDLTLTVLANQGGLGAITSADLVPGTAGVFTLDSKTPAEIQAALRATTFSPAENSLLPNLSQVITFRLEVEDSDGLRAVDTTTRQVVLSRNDPPEIAGLPAGLSTPTRQLQLFAGATISDPEAGALDGPEPVVLTLTFDDPSLGDIPNASDEGVVRLHSGLYRASGEPDDITTALRALVYELDPTATPSAGEVGVRVDFTVSVTDAPGATAEVSDTAIFFTNQRIWVVDQLTVGDPGTDLEEVLAHADLADSDIIVIAPSPNDVPGTIELSDQVMVEKNLTILGPGADLVEIRPRLSGGGTSGSGSLFMVGKTDATPVQLKLSGLTLAGGVAASRGGAVDVRTGGRLALADCEIVDCSARVAGGGVAIRGGSLIAERCLFVGNATDSTARVGGGALSLETNRPIVLRNCTFSGNTQGGGGAFGGGAIYIENTVLNRDLFVTVESCTFAGNVDAAGKASSLFANVGRTLVSIKDTVFGDGSGQTLDTSGAAEIDSLGGNVIDGEAKASVSQGIGVGDLIFLDQGTDLRNTDPLLEALADNGGTVRTHALGAGSLAIGRAGSPPVDGRSVIRDGDPDSGASEAGTFERLLINEIGMDTVGGAATDFVEIYNPRDSQPINPNGFKIRVAGSTAAPVVISGQPTLAPGVGVSIVLGIDLSESGGTVELLDSADAVVHEATYLNDFAPGGATMPTDANQSLVRAPEFTIGGFLPHRFVSGQALEDEGSDPLTAEVDSPDLDVLGVPLDGTNAPPVARDDMLGGFDEDTVSPVNVLANDIERDRTNSLKVVSLATTTSTLGAVLSIAPDGLSVSYDPTLPDTVPIPAVPNPLQHLHEGEVVTDEFVYTIQDFDSTGVLLTANYDLLKATATARLTVTGINDAPVADDDGSFDAQEDERLAIFADMANAGASPFLFHPSLGTVAVAPGWLLENDDDIDNDNDNTDLEVVGIGQADRLTGISLCGAPVVLDVRTDRAETHILYSPTDSAVLNTLAAGQTVTDSFTYVIRDRHGATATATVTLLVHGTNDGPNAEPDALAAVEGTPVTWPNAMLAGNDTDPDTAIHEGAPISGSDDFLTVWSVESFSELGAAVSVDTLTGAVTYNPTTSDAIEALRRGETREDTFSYVVRDQADAESTALATVLVTGINDKPIALPDVAYVIDEDSLLTVSREAGLLLNDTDIDIDNRPPDDSLRVLPGSLFSLATGAQVELANDGSFTFDPRGNADFNSLATGETLIETFQYTVIDNSYLYAVNDTFTVAQDSPEIELPVLANDAPVHDPSLGFVITAFTQGNQGGTVRFVDELNRLPGSGLVYTPLAGFVGLETFTYGIADGRGGIDTSTVIVKVVNDALNGSLVANDDAFRVGVDTAGAILPVLANDGPLPDPGAPLAIIAATGADIAPDGLSLIYTPPAGETAPQTLEYTISGGGIALATAEVEIELVALSLRAQEDSFSLRSNSQVLDVLANDGPRPGSPGLTVASLSGADAADFEIRDGGVAHTGAFPLAAAKSFSYTATDPSGALSAPTAVEVLPAGTTLRAHNDHYLVGTVGSGSTAGYLLHVLANDLAIPAGAALTITGIGLDGNLPNHGLATIEGTAIRYVPDPDSVEDDTFTYEIGIPGSLARRSAMVSVTVDELRETLAPNHDTFTVSLDSVATRLDVLANDLPLPDTGAVWTIDPVFSNDPVHGVASVTPDGSAVIYTPNRGFVGEDSLTYKTHDGLGGTGEAVVTIEVGDRPLNPDLFVVLGDSADNDFAVLSNDNVLPEDASSYDLTGVSALVAGSLATVVMVDDIPHVRYTPPAGFTGFDTLTYTVQDNTLRSFEGTVIVEVIDPEGDRAHCLVQVRVDGRNDVPVVGGTSASSIADNLAAGLPPFTGVTIADPDAGGTQYLRVTLTLDDPEKGILVGDFAERSGGRYTLEGSPADVTAALQALIFQPAENVVTVDQTNPLGIEISVDDGFVAAPVVDNATVIQITAINDAPSITGTVSGLTVYRQDQVRPFVGVTIADPDDRELQSLQVTVAIDDAAKGGLSNLGGFAAGAAGVYTMTGSPAQVTEAIRGLIFTPTPGGRVFPFFPETAAFTVTVADGFSVPEVDDETSVIVLDALVDMLWADDTLVPGSGGSPRTSKRAIGREFGAAVSVSGDWLAVGAPMDPQIDDKAGAVYLFRRDPAVPESWTQMVKILASDGRKYAEFGRSVSLSGDLLIVGAPFDRGSGDKAGAAYIFQRNKGGVDNWGQVARLSAPGIDKDDAFGTAVGLSGATAVVGSPDDESPNKSGAIYLFEKDKNGLDQWGHTQRLQASDAAKYAAMGTSVAIDGHRIVAGAPGDETFGGDSGAAYIIGRPGPGGSWSHIKKVVAADGAGGARFGKAVAIHGNQALIGAPEANVLGNRSGAAYLFSPNPAAPNDWVQVRRLTAFDGRGGDRFGSGVSLWDETAVVGAFYDGHLFDNHSNESKFGSAYVYERDRGGVGNWGLVEKLTSRTPANNDEYGSSVSAYRGTVVVGAHFSHAPAGACDGGVIQLVLLYDGAAPAQVVVRAKDNAIVFDGAVGPGEAFSFHGVQSDYKLGSSITLLVNGATHASLHTSCSQDIGPGTRAGDFVVLEGLSREGGLLLAPGETGRGRPGAAFVNRFKFNNAPLPAQLSPDEAVATQERSFTYQMPPGAIGDPDVGDSLIFSATGVGGAALPSWLSFNLGTQILTGVPTLADVGTTTVEIHARDEDDATTFYQLVITVELGGPFLEVGSVSGVTNTGWTPVALSRSYAAMVVVATPVYGDGMAPLITQVQNALGNQFEVRVTRADGLGIAVTPLSVEYFVLEAGSYTEAAHGIKMEAARFESSVTDSSGSWVGEAQVYDNAYDSPVVFGQVMTVNDDTPSSFWARGATPADPPSAGSLWVGKHVGEGNPADLTANETIGYVVVEAGSGRIRTPDGLRGFVAGHTVAPFLSELAPVAPVDFSALAVSSHGAAGEDNGAFTVLDGGQTLLLTADAWKSVALSGTVDAATMLEFDFLSTSEGEIHAAGFDDDGVLSPDRAFQVHGTEVFGLQEFNDYPAASAYEHYRIPAGNFAAVQGAYDRLVFAADDDRLLPTGHSFFTNVTIREGTLRGYAYELPMISPTHAVLSKAGMQETDGGWPVLHQGQGLGATGFGVAVDEDQLADAERVHVPTDVAFIVFGTPDGSIPAIQIPDPAIAGSGFGRWSISRHGAESVADAALAETIWGFAADPDGDGVPNLLDYAAGLREQGQAAALRIERLASGDTRLSYLRRSDDSRLRLSLEASATMEAGWLPLAVALLEETVEPVSEDYERVEIDVAGATIGRVFFRLRVRYASENGAE